MAGLVGGGGSEKAVFCHAYTRSRKVERVVALDVAQSRGELAQPANPEPNALYVFLLFFLRHAERFLS